MLLVGDALEEHTLTLLARVLQKGQARSTHNRRACMIRICIYVDEAKGVSKDLSRWRSAVSAYPHGKRREFIYVCTNIMTRVKIITYQSIMIWNEVLCKMNILAWFPHPEG